MTAHDLLYAALVSFFLAYGLWIFYLAVMALKRALDEKRLSTPARVLGYPILGTGLFIDMVTNIIVFSILFLEPPHELTVTSRLSRHIRVSPQSWRGRMAYWFCHNLLDTFDPSGKHCK